MKGGVGEWRGQKGGRCEGSPPREVESSIRFEFDTLEARGISPIGLIVAGSIVDFRSKQQDGDYLGLLMKRWMCDPFKMDPIHFLIDPSGIAHVPSKDELA